MQSNLRSKDPFHVAIIMDGNGRWATRQGLPRSAGHRAGVQALRAIVEAAPELAISTLTLFALSSDNWKRPAGELAALIALMRAYLRSEGRRFIENGARLVVIGRLDRLPLSLQSAIRRLERESENGTRIKIRIALDYSARDSIVRAGCAAAEGEAHEAAAPTERAAAAVKNARERLARMLTTPASGGPPGTSEDAEVDLLIRTGGEQRLSDFMLWELAYAELIFTDVMWPDFRPQHLRSAIEEFRRRVRRFGGVEGYTRAACAPQGGHDERSRDPI